MLIYFYRQIRSVINYITCISVVGLVLFININTAKAQEAFSEIRFTATAQKHLGNTDFTRHWTPNAGFGFELSTPYYVGGLEAGIRVFRFDAFSFENSGFYSHYVFAGWHYKYAAGENLFLVPGFRLGNNFMLHDEDKIYMDEYKFSREESEFFYEILLRLEMDITNNFGFYLSTAYNRTLFNIPFPAFYGTAGLTLKLQSPGWLKQSLQ